MLSLGTSAFPSEGRNTIVHPRTTVFEKIAFFNKIPDLKLITVQYLSGQASLRNVLAATPPDDLLMDKLSLI